MTEPINHPRAAFAAALAELQTQLPKISKDKTAKIEKKTGGNYSYKYSDLEQVSEAILPLLGKLGMSFTSCPTLNQEGKFVLEYELLHVSGQSKTGQWPLPQSGSPQEMGGLITYYRRNCLCAVTGVTTGDDDDAATAQAGMRRRSQAVKEEGREPGVNAEQQRQMSTLFQAAPEPVEGKDARLKYVVDTIKRPINSSTELTRAEAGKVIARLESWIEQNEPPTDAA